MAEAQVRPASVADFTFKAADKTTEDLKVTGFAGTEEISRLFSFRVELCSDDPDIAFDEIVGKACVLEISAASGSRLVNGIVRRFERTGEGSSLTYYAAEIVPVHWLLTKRHKSRIFQGSNCPDMTVPGIIKKVFEDAGIPSDNYRLALQGSYDTREYVVQYRESEMNFISRLMEEEGIFFFFEHSAEGHTMVIGDSPVAHTPTPNASEFAYRERTGLVSEREQEYVYEIRDGQEVQTGAVWLDDFDFTKPQLQLAAAVTADQYASLEYSDYPGEYVDKSVGERYAKVRLEEFQCQRRVLQMNATVRALLPGFKFTLIEHPTPALNREYLVTRIVHDGAQPQSAAEEAGAERGIEYKATVRAIPSEAPFRPPRITPKPVVQGTQTAIVVGPSGEEIYTDKYGRVKVQYFWDREGKYDENSSRWTRVSQGSAGGLYGSIFLPRIGQEVIVDFLEGDPDRPIITGRVYNGDHMPPYSLPDEKTKSCIKTNSSKGGGGTNEIRFEDSKDNEQILVYAQKDLHVRVINDRVENVQNNRYLTVKKNKYELVKEKKHSEVKLDFNEKIGGKRSLEVAGDVAEDFKANHSQQVGINHYLKAGTNVVVEAGVGLTFKVGSNFIAIDPSGVTIQGTLVKINSPGGVAGSASACALEAPGAPEEADQAVPGKDVRYGAAEKGYEPLEVPTEAAASGAEEVQEKEKKSWIEIELVDKQGKPVPRQRYELRLPDGKIKKGVLDDKGQAREAGIDPGDCEVRFPDVECDTWKKL